MCTLIAAHGLYADFPLVVAANRDENLTRPAQGPQPWPGQPAFVAPRDEVAGGTWLGLNAAGVFVAVTNRFAASKDASRASRGALVVEALAAASARALHGTMAKVPPSRFNAFHLFYADRAHAFVSWSDGDTLQQQPLSPGVHIVTERSLGGDDRARTERIQRAYPRVRNRAQAPEPSQLFELLRIHDEADRVGGTCIHVPELGYGTRSSLVLRLAAGWEQTELWWSEGPACEGTLTPKPELVAALRAR